MAKPSTSTWLSLHPLKLEYHKTSPAKVGALFIFPKLNHLLFFLFIFLGVKIIQQLNPGQGRRPKQPCVTQHPP